MSEHEILAELQRKNAEARANLQQSRSATVEGSTPENAEKHRRRREMAEREKQMSGKKQTGLGDF